MKVVPKLDALLLKKTGLRREDLNYLELETYANLCDAFERKEATLEDVKKMLKSEHERTGTELEEYENDPKKDLYLKCYRRLIRKMLAFLESPEKARAFVEQEIEKMAMMHKAKK